MHKLPPAASAPANSIMYKPCPFCGSGNPHNPVKELRTLQPKMITDGNSSAVICQNLKCGACAPTYSWNNRYTAVRLIGIE